MFYRILLKLKFFLNSFVFILFLIDLQFSDIIAEKLSWKSFIEDFKPFNDSVLKDISNGKRYDTIIVGGGAAGCVLARTLVDNGQDVLLIERGGSRHDHKNTQNIQGAGWVINDPKVSQVVFTEDGIRSHIGSILSGGTAINMGIIIQEQQEFLEYLETFPGVKYDKELFQESANWITEQLASKYPETPTWEDSFLSAMESKFGGFTGQQTQLQVDSVWQSLSLFNADDDYFRLAADVVLYRNQSTTTNSTGRLSILLKHTVDKVIINKDVNTTTNLRHASCVKFHTTRPQDVAPLGQVKDITGDVIPRWTEVLLRIIYRAPKNRYKNRENNSDGTSMQVCVKQDGGRVILSAGAILTPLILYKSGVGPVEAVQNSKAELVQEMPDLGAQLIDRAMFPIGLFFKKNFVQKNKVSPEASQYVGFSYKGEKCSKQSYIDHSTQCSAILSETIFNGYIAEGVFFSTRMALLPELRNSPAFNFIFEILEACSQKKMPLNSPVYLPLCAYVNMISECFSRSLSLFYFTADPRSVGKLKVNKDGTVLVYGNYLKDPQDVKAAIKGVQNLLSLIEEGGFDSTLEPASISSCPLNLLNTLLSIANDHIVESRLKKVNTVGNSTFRKNENSFSLDQIKLLLLQEKLAFMKSLLDWPSNVPFNRTEVELYLNSTEIHSILSEHTYQRRGENLLSESTYYNASAFLQDEVFLFNTTLNGSKKTKNYTPVSLKFATYPPSIPARDNIAGLADYVQTWMTSVWHWVGSAQMGKVVDENFKVFQFDNLYIVDASVLNQVTRMNPNIHIMALGRYAALKLLK